MSKKQKHSHNHPGLDFLKAIIILAAIYGMYALDKLRPANIHE